MSLVLLALGSNLGDRSANLRMAVARLAEHPRVAVRATSDWQATNPAGGSAGQGEFLNGATLVETSLAPEELLDWTQEVERRGGRVREAVWGPRTIDIDLLLIEGRSWKSERLEVPHRRSSFRCFMIEPACQLAPDWIHPHVGWSLARLATFLRTAPLYVAVTGSSRSRRESLIAAALERVTARWIQGGEVSSRAAAVRLLNEATENPVDEPLVSDFWCEEWPEEATGAVKGPSPRVAPKLVVYLEDVDGSRQDGGSEKVNEQRRLRGAVESPGHGPWLVLESRDEARHVDELVGALQALA